MSLFPKLLSYYKCVNIQIFVQLLFENTCTNTGVVRYSVSKKWHNFFPHDEVYKLNGCFKNILSYFAFLNCGFILLTIWNVKLLWMAFPNKNVSCKLWATINNYYHSCINILAKNDNYRTLLFTSSLCEMAKHV